MHLCSSCTSQVRDLSKLHVLACVLITLLRCPFQCSCYSVTGCGSMTLHSAHSKRARRGLYMQRFPYNSLDNSFGFFQCQTSGRPVRLRGVKCFRVPSGSHMLRPDDDQVRSYHIPMLGRYILFMLSCRLVDSLLDLAVPRKLVTLTPACV